MTPMKRIIYIVALLATLCATSSCLQNNGYIGELFGQWRLEKIVTGEKVEPCDTVFFAFQSNLFQMRKANFNFYEYTLLRGYYERTPEYIRFNILNHNTSNVKTEEEIERALRDTRSFYVDEINPVFDIERLTYREMILLYKGHTYYFVKVD